MNEGQVQGRSVLAPRIYEYVLAGLLLTGGAGAAIGYHVYYGFVAEEISRDRAYWGIGLPFVGLVAGIYLFAYGWQRGDVEKAVRMSMWLTLGALGIIVAVLGALAVKRSARNVGGGSSFFLFGSTRRRRRSGFSFGWGGDQYDDEYGLGGTLFDNQYEDSAPETLEVHCRKCGGLFIPQPPRALCPNCGFSALDKAG